MNDTDKPQASTIQESLQTVLERVRGYNNQVAEGEPIQLHVDGLCENPGEMHLGLWGHQGDKTLFAEHMFVGYGTCNEAEYLAVKCGVLIMQGLFPQAAATQILPDVTVEDIIVDQYRRAPAFVSKLNRTANRLAAELKTRFSGDLQRALGVQWSDLNAFGADLAAELNGVVHGPLLYDAELFAGVNLRPVTQHLLGHGPTSRPLLRLNRLLLEDAFPFELSWEAPLKVFSDSQIVTLQVDGNWHTKNDNMQSYCQFLRRLRRTYYYGLTKIPREENTIADSLAQKYILKNSGRCMYIDNQRLNVSKQVPPAVKKKDLFKTIAPQESIDFLEKHNLRPLLLRVLQLARDGEGDEAIEAARCLEKTAQKVLESVPKTNEMFRMWVTNTVRLIQMSIPMMISAIEKGNEVDIQYIAEEIARNDTSGSALYESQAEMIRNGVNPFQDTQDRASGGEEEEI